MMPTRSMKKHQARPEMRPRMLPATPICRPSIRKIFTMPPSGTPSALSTAISLRFSSTSMITVATMSPAATITMMDKMMPITSFSRRSAANRLRFISPQSFVR